MHIAERPIIYEINTAVFLNNLSQKYKQIVTLADIPKSEWDELGELPIDAVWLMGVWKRSPSGREIALKNPEYKKLLPDLKDEDVLGSSYCVNEYVVDDRFGGPNGLASARRELQSRNIGLILDFVPNHVALDHPWVVEHPEYFIQGTEKDAKHHEKAFYRSSNSVIARGKDPNYDPWYDVAQLNAFSGPYRKAAIETLKDISSQCDGVRCDMAMLMGNDIFAHTWKERAGLAPGTEFWSEVITATRESSPDFLFLAEVYWDKHEDMFNQGFDLCYDKTAYDIIDKDRAHHLYEHLISWQTYQKKLLRFMENHDEERSASILKPKQLRAAAVMLTTLEGARLYLDGQFEGYTHRIPVQLARGPDQQPDVQLQKFYRDLLKTFAALKLKGAEWALLESKSVHLNLHSRNIIAWAWYTPSSLYLMIVNYSDKNSKAKINLKASRTSSIKTIFADNVRNLKKKDNLLSAAFGEYGYAILEIPLIK